MKISNQFVNQIVEMAVNRIAPVRSTLDKTARDSDDYRQLLHLKAWQTMRTVPDHGKDVFMKWQFVVVRNQLNSYRRELCRYPEVSRCDFLSEEDYGILGFEKHMELRDLLHKLHGKITDEEWELLINYVAHGCNASSVWKLYGQQVSESYFRRQLKTLCERCQRILSRM